MLKKLAVIGGAGLLVALVAGEAHAAGKREATATIIKGQQAPQTRGRYNIRLPRDLPLKYLWSIPFEGHEIKWKGVYVYDDVILVLSTSHLLYKIRKHDGVVEWVVELRSDIDKGFDPIVTDVGIYVIIDNELILIDKDAGRIVWKLEPDFAMSCLPTIVEPNVYVASWDGKFYSLSVRSKERIFVQGKTREDSLIDRKYWLTANWHLTTKGHITEPARLRDNILYFGSEDDYFYAVNREGKERYRFQTQGPIKAPSTTKPSRVYVGSTDFNLYALNRLTGEKEWEFPTGNVVRLAPYVDFRAGVVVAPSYRNGIYGIDERSGNELWHITDGLRVVAVGEELFYLSLTKKRLMAVEKKTGKVRWLSLLKHFRFAVSAPNDYTKRADPMRVYFATGNNILLCMKEREADTGPWTPGAGLRARGEARQ